MGVPHSRTLHPSGQLKTTTMKSELKTAWEVYGLSSSSRITLTASTVPTVSIQTTELETVSLAGRGPHGSLSMSAFRRSLQHNLKADSLKLSQSFAPTTHV